jgi:hypothetical protein
MSLAQVIYNISNDSDFASKWRNDPEAALAGKGLKLSREELVFLSEGLTRSRYGGSPVRLSDLARQATNWRD